MSDDSKFVARRGDEVTCENGHPICTVATDIERGSTLQVAQFKDWKIAQPKSQEPVTGCPICGAPYIKSGFRAAIGIHVNGQWRRSDRS